MKKFLIRLDDACPFMNAQNWHRVEDILDRYEVKPLVGIIPDCKDKEILIDAEDTSFWRKVRCWQDKGWSIALHGYDHCYVSNDSGINPMWARSEFAGLSLNEQIVKIRQGVAILKSKGIAPNYFFAPSHTFDDNTLIALKNESEIRIVSDTIGRYPYKYGDFYIIPQIVGHCTNIPIPGYYTFCLHPNTMSEQDFVKLDSFLCRKSKFFISFDDIKLSDYGEKKLLDRFLSSLYFYYRKVRGLV